MFSLARLGGAALATGLLLLGPTTAANAAAHPGPATRPGPAAANAAAHPGPATHPGPAAANAAARPEPPTASPHAAYPVTPNLVAAASQALADPTQSPPGANVAGCRPGAAHPYPVVLVPGTFANMEDNYAALAPTLANAGYCVYSLNYGGVPGAFIQSVGPVPDSAAQIARFVANVLALTGSDKVDLVGHSQGGLQVEYYAKILGGAPHIHTLVALSPTTHGTTLDGLTVLAQAFPGANAVLGAACPACVDQEAGSAVVNQLDAGPIAQPGPRYTVIETRLELVVTPVGSSFIAEPGVTNLYVQDQCPNDLADHANLAYDQVVFQDVENALDPSTAHAPNCLHAFPYPA